MVFSPVGRSVVCGRGAGSSCASSITSPVRRPRLPAGNELCVQLRNAARPGAGPLRDTPPPASGFSSAVRGLGSGGHLCRRPRRLEVDIHRVRRDAELYRRCRSAPACGVNVDLPPWAPVTSIETPEDSTASAPRIASDGSIRRSRWGLAQVSSPMVFDHLEDAIPHAVVTRSAASFSVVIALATATEYWPRQERVIVLRIARGDEVARQASPRAREPLALLIPGRDHRCALVEDGRALRAPVRGCTEHHRLVRLHGGDDQH